MACYTGLHDHNNMKNLSYASNFGFSTEINVECMALHLNPSDVVRSQSELAIAQQHQLNDVRFRFVKDITSSRLILILCKQPFAMPSGQPVDWINVALRTAARAGVEVAAVQLHSRFAAQLDELRDHEMGYVCVLTFRSTDCTQDTGYIPH